MATKEQVDNLLEKLDKARPTDLFRKVDETQAGIGAVLRILYESEDLVTAGKLSELLEVSTARVAVLIKKMVSKGLVTKERWEKDSRVTIVRLTELGTKTIVEKQEEMYCQVGKVIDMIGEERLMEFVAMAEEIKNVIVPPKFDF